MNHLFPQFLCLVVLAWPSAFFGVDRWRWQHDKTISVIGQNGTVVSMIDFSIED